MLECKIAVTAEPRCHRTSMVIGRRYLTTRRPPLRHTTQSSEPHWPRGDDTLAPRACPRSPVPPLPPRRAAPSSSAPARSAPRSRCCSRAAACARRCRRAPPSRPSACSRTRENASTCPGVELPRELRIERGRDRARARRLRVPRRAVARARRGDRAAWPRPAWPGARASSRWPRASCRPTARAPTVAAARALRRRARRLHRRPRARAGDGHARAPGSSPPPPTRRSRAQLAAMFIRAGVVCEQSNDPVGVELAGAAKNAAALAAGATEAQGLNAAGAAAGHIFAEVWRFAERLGRAAGVDDRPRRDRRPGRDRARAAEPQPPRRRAARRRACRRPRSRRGSARRSSRWSRFRCWRAALDGAGVDAPVTTRAGAPDRRRPAARRLGRARAHDGPAACPLARGRPGTGRAACGGARGRACAAWLSRAAPPAS